MFSISRRISVTRAATSALLPAPSIIVVLSFVITTRRALPNIEISICSSFKPTSAEITWPPVRIAMSCNIALRRSPKPGALTAAEAKVPRIRLTTKVESASPSTSSAIIKSGLLACATFSSTGRTSDKAEIFEPEIRMYASSKIVSMRSASVTKYGEI